MAARDILNLSNSMAPRLIRCLYIVALILIAAMVVLGAVRGVRVMTRPPFAPPAVTDTAPDATAPPRPGMMMGRRFNGRMMMDRRFGRPSMGPLGMGRISRNPMLGGFLILLGTLLRGVIALMVVRILAEIGLAVLAMPRKSEI